MGQGNSIAIIGAGLAGVTAAIRLLEKGYKVKVFERQEEIGGKCLTKKITIDGKLHSVDMGATVAAFHFHNLIKYARILEEPLIHTTPYNFIQDTGKITPLRPHYWRKGARLRMIPQLKEYLKRVNEFQSRYLTKTGYKENLPEVYHLPFARYCLENGMEDLVHWFDLPVAAWGYKTQTELPAWYILGEVDILGFFGLVVTIMFGKSIFVKGLLNGYGELVKKMAKNYDLDILTGAEVHTIIRNGDNVVVESNLGSETFDHVVISSPHLVEALSNPSKAESHFLKELRYAPYATVLCSLTTQRNTKLIIKSNLAKKIGVKMIAVPYRNCALAVCYVRIDNNFTVPQVKKLVRHNLDSLNIGIEQIHEVKIWKDFFPHFASFKGYQSLLSAQGQNRTVYIGSINQFEFSEVVMSTSIHLMNRYFPDLIPLKKEKLSWLKNTLYWIKT